VSAEILSRLSSSASLAAGADGALPTEFRIFKYGVNETSKGSCLFDEQAAAAVMARFEKEGRDLMIDLEHHWSDNSASARPDAADARGWCKLEVRNGELWATSVTWTPDGARRLTEKTQRYTSPLFFERKADSRVVRVVNVALVANPATFGAEPLVAASAASVCVSAPACHALTAFVLRRYTSREPMNPELMKKLLGIIASQDEKAALALLAEIAAAAAGGAPAEPAAATAEPLAAAADPPVPGPGDKKPEEAAALTALSKLAGGATEPGEIVRKLSEMAATVAKISADSAALETSERRGLVATLVKLGVELPATAWEGDPSKLVVCKRLSDEPIADLRARVETIKAARPKALNLEAPPKGTSTTDIAEQVKALSAAEVNAAKAAGMTPEQFITAKQNAVRRA
jgi:phage I-like protein